MRCEAAWDRLPAGPQRVALPKRCELAVDLATAAIKTLAVTDPRWWDLAGDPTTFVAWVGRDRGERLIADSESCPRREVWRPHHAPEFVNVEFVGEADLALAWTELRSDNCNCTATFSAPLADERAAPTLTIEVAMDASEAFVVTRQALEMR